MINIFASGIDSRRRKKIIPGGARIRSLDRKYAVRGNEEKYLENLFGLWKRKG